MSKLPRQAPRNHGSRSSFTFREPLDNTLDFTRADGSRITFSNDASLFVWCGPWEEDVILTPSLQILFGGPGAGNPRWHLRAVVADVRIADAFSFPNEFIWDVPKGVDIFVHDPPNELSTDDNRSDGSVTFQQLQCETGGHVEFSIDAVVGSEYHDGRSIGFVGSFLAPLGAPPSFNSNRRQAASRSL